MLSTGVARFSSVSLIAALNFVIPHISWWKQLFLVTFNRQSMMLDFRQPIFFQTDASVYGFGALCSNDWFAGSWTACPAADHMLLQNLHWSTAGHAIDPLLCLNIDYLGLFPILLAARRWGPKWANKCVWVETDNTQAMSFINNGTCKNPIARTWLREIFWLSIPYNFHLHSRHLPGKFNHDAAQLSHLLQNPVLSPAL